MKHYQERKNNKKNLLQRLKPIVIAMYIWVFFPTTFLFGANLNPWTQKAETEDGIVVCTRSLPDSGIKEAKASCTIPASPAQVFKTIMDYNTYKNISEYIQTTEFLPSDEKNAWYMYQRLDLPIVSDRDYTLRYHTIENPRKNSYQVLWEIANNKGPAVQKNVVRVVTCHGSLTIQPDDKTPTTRISYILYTDPGGYIPDWLVNFANRRSIPDVLRAIRKHSVSPPQNH